MDTLASFAAAIEATGFVHAMKFSPLWYSLANTAHVLGVALLVGAILPMDLRLLGLWRGVGREELARVLVPIAAFGLLLAVSAGLVLFSVRAGHYVGVTIFYWKLCLITLGTVLALLFHVRAGLWLESATDRQAALHGAASLCCWLGALVAGRMIAYFPNWP
ncbi:hypothetical protein G5B40_10320 [Pikeienuella piscinae]|uniref:DUF2214 domain-containing protein n=1 Tax=Pikeienuella piscinae TaxID=2748098 RepID=A0A7L5BWJ2_9RHOB|nr:hypothetical protein [Pikeienuella piscinae]QIE55811.1 hypothetical protein G5B40_10320 [Pikeienuella piscinae]